MKLGKRSSSLHERWQTFKFRLSSTDVTKRRNGAGCSTFGGQFPFYCFLLTGTSLPAERRFDPSAATDLIMSAISKYICYPLTRSTSLCEQHRKMAFAKQTGVTRVRSCCCLHAWSLKFLTFNEVLQYD